MDWISKGTPCIFDPITGQWLGVSSAIGEQYFPFTLSQSAVAVGILSSCTIGNNGALTGLTALPAPYSTGTGLYAYFQQGQLNTTAAASGYAAGFYWAVPSSTTAATVYNITYTTGDPVAPTSAQLAANPIVSTTPIGAMTQVTTAQTLRTNTLPGGVLSANGLLENDILYTASNTANNKTMALSFGGTTALSMAAANFATFRHLGVIRNNGSTNSQMAFGGGYAWNGSAGTPVMAAVNTSNNVAITHTGQLAVATDYIILAGSFIRVTP